MLTTNQVPFIAQVSVIHTVGLWKCQVFVIPYSWAMKVPNICCTKGYTT